MPKSPIRERRQRLRRADYRKLCPLPQAPELGGKNTPQGSGRQSHCGMESSSGCALERACRAPSIQARPESSKDARSGRNRRSDRAWQGRRHFRALRHAVRLRSRLERVGHGCSRVQAPEVYGRSCCHPATIRHHNRETEHEHNKTCRRNCPINDFLDRA